MDQHCSGTMSNPDQSDELLEAEAHVWNQIFNFIKSMSLKCAVELGIPDTIHKYGRPVTLHELVEALPGVEQARANSLYRLMRTLVHMGFFATEKIHSLGNNFVEGYVLTRASRLLIQDHSFSMKPFTLFLLDPIMTEPWNHLSRWFQSSEDPTAFYTSSGMSYWEKKAKNPMFSRLFDEGMASDTPMVTSAIVGVCRHMFTGLVSLVDVGGGTGTLAKAIVEAFPWIRCTVLDLPSVVGGLEGEANLKYVEGDMFRSIPPADAVLLKWILHDWSDEESIQILKKCKEALRNNYKNKRGKVIIIEMVVDEKNTNHKSLETQLLFDMLMMTVLNGKERSEKEWAKLFSDAGFSDYKIFPLLGLRSIIEVYP